MEQSYECSKCGASKPWSKFQLFKGRPGGQCRECKTAAMKEKRKRDGIPVRRMSRIEDGKKLCLGCDAMKPLDDFFPSSRGRGGVMAYCKPCFADKYHDPKKAREAMAKYRKVNRGRWLAMHRIHQFERRYRIKVTDDGTVTDEFMSELYARKNCHYCGCETDEGERTADHVVSLRKGGAHSASNLVMACRSCNSSKSAKTGDEFINYRERNVKNDN